jgi:phage regulator Rha-like protein
MKSLITAQTIERKIYLIRGQKVMLDSDLAELYEVPTKALVQAVKRNANRFPRDFMFQLENHDVAGLRSQIVTLKQGRGTHRKYLPYAFTEQGVAMLSSVLNSDRAVEVNIQIIRVFVKLREMIASHKDLVRRLDELEKKYDAQFRVVFDAIRELMTPPDEEQRKIGFLAKESRAIYETRDHGHYKRNYEKDM